jgi:hypothetical protein
LQTFTIDYISPDAVEVIEHQRRFTPERVTVEWMRRYSALLERFGKPQASFAWSDRALHLQRFCLLPTDDRGLMQHAMRWHTVGRADHPPPDYVVTIDPQNPMWAFPEDPAARERFRWYGGAGFPPQDIYGIAFLAPPGYYILKGTIEAVLDDQPAGPFSVPLLRPLTPEPQRSRSGGADWELESKVRMMEAMRQAFTLPPEQRDQRLRELREQEMRERASMTQTYLTPPGTPGMWAQLPVAPKVISKDFRDLVPVPLRGWKFSFVLTRSPTETALPAWMLNVKTVALKGYQWSVTVDPPGTELRVNGVPPTGMRLRDGDREIINFSVPGGEVAHLALRSPDGRQKSFDLRAVSTGHFLLSTRNGWKPIPEPLPGRGFLLRDRQGIYWFASTRTEPTQKRTDIYLQQSRDLVTWSEALALPFNTAYTERSPHLVQQPDGALRLIFFSDRPSPTGGNIWTATSEDGVQWSEPTPIKESGDLYFSASAGMVSFRFYGNGTDVWISTDGQRYQRERAHRAGVSPNDEFTYLTAVAPAADGTLRGIWRLPPAPNDPPGTQCRLVEVTTTDGVRWEMGATLFKLPSGLRMGSEGRGFWHTRHGWIALFDRQVPGTGRTEYFWVLLRSQDDARLLPPLWMPLPPPDQWIEAGDQLIAVWSSSGDDNDGDTHLWTCPVDEIADQPMDALPRFNPQNMR